MLCNGTFGLFFLLFFSLVWFRVFGQWFGREWIGVGEVLTTWLCILRLSAKTVSWLITRYLLV